MIAAVVTLLGTLLVKHYGLGWNWRMIIIIAQVMIVCVDTFPTFLTIWDIVRNQWLWLGVPLLEYIPYAATDYIGVLFMLEVQTGGNDATLFGLAATARRLGTLFGTVMTKTVNGYLDNRAQLHRKGRSLRAIAGHDRVRDRVLDQPRGCCVCAAHPEAEGPHAQDAARGDPPRAMGTATLVVLSFALAWTLMTNILSLFPTTKCLRIAGGSGCN